MSGLSQDVYLNAGIPLTVIGGGGSGSNNPTFSTATVSSLDVTGQANITFLEAGQISSIYGEFDELSCSSLSTTFADIRTLNCSSISTLGIYLDGALLTTAGGSELLLNGVPVATTANVSSLSDWSFDPAVSTLNMNANSTINSSGYFGTGTVSTATVEARTGNIDNLICNTIFTNTLTAQSTVHIVSTISSLQVEAQAALFSSINGQPYIPFVPTTDPVFNTVRANVSVSTPEIFVSTINGQQFSAIVPSANPVVSTLTASTFVSTQGLYVSSINDAAYPPPATSLADWARFVANSNVDLNNYALINSLNDLNVTANAGNLNLVGDRTTNVATGAVVNMTAKNGNGGTINILADSGYGFINGGAVNITANGGSTAGLNGRVSLTANGGTAGSIGVGGVLELIANSATGTLSNATSKVSMSGGGVNIYSGIGSPFASVFGYTFLNASLGISLVAGAWTSGFQVPGSVFLYGASGIVHGSDTYLTNVYPQWDGLLAPNNINIQGRTTIAGTAYVTLNNVSSMNMAAGGAITGVNSINNAAYPPVFATPVDLTASTITVNNTGNLTVGEILGVSSINNNPWPPTYEPPSVLMLSTLTMNSTGYIDANVITGVSSINNIAYPPPVGSVPSDLVVSTLQVSSSIFATRSMDFGISTSANNQTLTIYNESPVNSGIVLSTVSNTLSLQGNGNIFLTDRNDNDILIRNASTSIKIGALGSSVPSTGIYVDTTKFLYNGNQVGFATANPLFSTVGIASSIYATNSMDFGISTSANNQTLTIYNESPVNGSITISTVTNTLSMRGNGNITLTDSADGEIRIRNASTTMLIGNVGSIIPSTGVFVDTTRFLYNGGQVAFATANPLFSTIGVSSSIYSTRSMDIGVSTTANGQSLTIYNESPVNGALTLSTATNLLSLQGNGNIFLTDKNDSDILIRNASTSIKIGALGSSVPSTGIYVDTTKFFYNGSPVVSANPLFSTVGVASSIYATNSMDFGISTSANNQTLTIYNESPVNSGIVLSTVSNTLSLQGNGNIFLTDRNDNDILIRNASTSIKIGALGSSVPSTGIYVDTTKFFYNGSPVVSANPLFSTVGVASSIYATNSMDFGISTSANNQTLTIYNESPVNGAITISTATNLFSLQGNGNIFLTDSNDSDILIRNASTSIKIGAVGSSIPSTGIYVDPTQFLYNGLPVGGTYTPDPVFSTIGVATSIYATGSMDFGISTSANNQTLMIYNESPVNAAITLSTATNLFSLQGNGNIFLTDNANGDILIRNASTAIKVGAPGSVIPSTGIYVDETQFLYNGLPVGSDLGPDITVSSLTALVSVTSPLFNSPAATSLDITGGGTDTYLDIRNADNGTMTLAAGSIELSTNGPTSFIHIGVTAGLDIALVGANDTDIQLNDDGFVRINALSKSAGLEVDGQGNLNFINTGAFTGAIEGVSTINGQPYVPGGSGIINAGVSTLIVAGGNIGGGEAGILLNPLPAAITYSVPISFLTNTAGTIAEGMASIYVAPTNVYTQGASSTISMLNTLALSTSACNIPFASSDIFVKGLNLVNATLDSGHIGYDEPASTMYLEAPLGVTISTLMVSSINGASYPPTLTATEGTVIITPSGPDINLYVPSAPYTLSGTTAAAVITNRAIGSGNPFPSNTFTQATQITFNIPPGWTATDSVSYDGFAFFDFSANFNSFWGVSYFTNTFATPTDILGSTSNTANALPYSNIQQVYTPLNLIVPPTNLSAGGTITFRIFCNPTTTNHFITVTPTNTAKIGIVRD